MKTRAENLVDKMLTAYPYCGGKRSYEETNEEQILCFNVWWLFIVFIPYKITYLKIFRKKSSKNLVISIKIPIFVP